MATSVMRIRVDDDLRTQAAAVFDKLGIDTPTAVRMFMKRAVLENGIPFRMTLPMEDAGELRGIQEMRQISEEAKQNGTTDMTLDEVNPPRL